MNIVIGFLKFFALYAWSFVAYYIFLYLFHPHGQDFATLFILLLAFGFFIVAPVWIILTIISTAIKATDKKQLAKWVLLFLVPAITSFALVEMNAGNVMDWIID